MNSRSSCGQRQAFAILLAQSTMNSLHLHASPPNKAVIAELAAAYENDFARSD
ncbi:hypothetical protein FE840_005745 [Peteryoungia desertarenae]|uniref:Uncharacterized protein n=1 Tax=Peteryoungia desertarenae TaxID=1813451 RepID=A0ABX6QLE3_9HYPH|nr:hypothetical protein [Peteryoungia desertarenae]QLF69082.1 hypothetical protein FE840_005745 [Peteryoungia desertarenae]